MKRIILSAVLVMSCFSILNVHAAGPVRHRALPPAPEEVARELFIKGAESIIIGATMAGVLGVLVGQDIIHSHSHARDRYHRRPRQNHGQYCDVYPHQVQKKSNHRQHQKRNYYSRGRSHKKGHSNVHRPVPSSGIVYHHQSAREHRFHR